MDRQEQLQRLRLRKLECQRHLRVVEQKLAANPRDLSARREREKLQALLAKLEAEERRLLGESAATGGESDATRPPESARAGGR